MKHTKLFSALLFAATLLLAACTPAKAETNAKLHESTQSLVVIEALVSGGTLEDAMNGFKEEGELSFEGENGDFGFYITSVNGYTPVENEYWAVYTTLGDYEGVSYSNAEYGTYEYGGKTLASASYGISGLPLIAGEYYVLTIATF